MAVQGPPRLRQFDADEFLQTVEHSGPQLTSGIKGDWEGLYRRYFKSPNFEGWYYQRQKEVNQKLQILHMDALCNSVRISFLICLSATLSLLKGYSTPVWILSLSATTMLKIKGNAEWEKKCLCGKNKQPCFTCLSGRFNLSAEADSLDPMASRFHRGLYLHWKFGVSSWYSCRNR